MQYAGRVSNHTECGVFICLGTALIFKIKENAHFMLMRTESIYRATSAPKI